MKDAVLLGLWRYMVGLPPAVMNKRLPRAKKEIEAHLGFMTEEHRQVRHFTVRELPRFGKALPPGYIAEKLGMSIEKTTQILGELERHMTFLFRNGNGEVTWAYPVTVEQTPHRITFDTREKLYAA